MWIYTFEAPKGERIYKDMCGIATLTEPFLWWNKTKSCWETDQQRMKNADKNSYSSHAPCRTFKAFKRHLKKHVIVLKNSKIVLVSKYRKHNIFAEFKDFS